MNKTKITKAIDEISVSIDILQATTDFYKEMESVEASELIKLNTIVHTSLRDSINTLIQSIGESDNVDKDKKETT